MTNSISEQLSDEEVAHWVAFSQIHGIGMGSRRVRTLFERLESMKTAWEAGPNVLKYLPGFDQELINKFLEKRKEVDPYQLLDKLKSLNIKALAYGDLSYPYRLREIHDPPVVLYVAGVIKPEDFQHVIGVVGTRRPTSYGHKQAKEIAYNLVAQGITIASGMAIGVDSLAHWGAIEGKGRTIAVLGCGPDVCYPSSNKRLYHTIIKEDKGIVVSEYFPGTKPETFYFPARNRIISGLSRALVVVEGGLSSGSLITAKLAFEQCREVFAVPGRIDNEMAKGPNELIRRSSAHIFTSCTELLNEMNWVNTPAISEVPSIIELYGREKEVYDMLSGEPVHFETLCEKTGMAPGEMSATLTMLELAGVAERLPGDWYAKVTITLPNKAKTFKT